MTVESDDRELRERFHELREEVGDSVPPFAVAPVSTTRRQPVPWTLAIIGAAATVAVLLLSGVFSTGQTPKSVIDLGAVAWSAPSDFLLETPGRDFLRTIPVISAEELAPTNTDPGKSAIDTSG